MSRPQFDPSTYAAQLAEKTQRLRELLAPFAAPEPEVFDSPREHYRLRAEFRLWREGEDRHYAMFEAGDKHTPILLDDFPIASLRINALMPRLRAAWQASEALSFKLFQVEFLTTLAGDALITLAYHRPLDAAWQAEAERLAGELGVSLIGRSRGKRIVIGVTKCDNSTWLFTGQDCERFGNNCAFNATATDTANDFAIFVDGHCSTWVARPRAFNVNHARKSNLFARRFPAVNVVE